LACSETGGFRRVGQVASPLAWLFDVGPGVVAADAGRLVDHVPDRQAADAVAALSDGHGAEGAL